MTPSSIGARMAILVASLAACTGDRPVAPNAALPSLEEASRSIATGVAAIDLGTLGGTVSVALAINNRGEVAGASTHLDGRLTMFVRSADGVMHDAGVPTFAQGAVPAAMNDDGVVTGTTFNPATAFRWSRRGGYVRVPGLVGDAYALAINARGEIAGHTELVPGSGQSAAFLWRPDTVLLFPVAAPQSSAASGINDRGVVVGTTYGIGGRRAFRWTASTGMRDAGAPGVANSAVDVSNGGTIVGDFEVADGTVRSYRLDEPGRGRDIGFFRDGHWISPVAVNDAGAIVALAFDARRRLASVRVRGAVMEELLPLASYAVVRSMNNCGRAVGYADTPDGTQHAVLWPGWC